MSKRRVVITGIGCVTSLAESPVKMFEGICKAESGVSLIESFDTSEFTVKIAGEARGFDVNSYIEHRQGKRMDRFTQMALASAIQAVEDSGLDLETEDRDRIGVIAGSGIGGLQEIEDQHEKLLNKGPRRVSPFTVPKLMGNAASGCISIHFGLRGPNMCIITACASASHAMGEAYYNIITGRSDCMVTGGSEAALTPVGLASFCSLKSLSTRNDTPTTASRPFDETRDGFVFSEGSGMLVFEEYEHAKKRGAKIYCEFLGYGATGDGYHITAPIPDGAGAGKAMKIALNDAGINPEAIDYVNAHGTSTELNDLAESIALRDVFGAHVYKLAVSSSKGSLGHLLGASGAVELITTALAIQNSVIPPTANLEKVDEKCDPKIDYVPKEARDGEIKIAISNSLGFGGHNCSLVIGKI
ncbi:MAG: beta-ketoacyl-ACP synthase II [Planctomycetes bacterium]|nr:beta-ketoacyl-ACP synthase II [Planctomycetota bacterium]